MRREADDARAFTVSLRRNNGIAQAFQASDSIHCQTQDALFDGLHPPLDALKNAQGGVEANNGGQVGGTILKACRPHLQGLGQVKEIEGHLYTEPATWVARNCGKRLSARYNMPTVC